jgi:pSer/pThr/pTyr-binding forkhead associated (FHA) protein
MEADVPALKVTAGVHKGAVIRLDTADMLVIGASDDCDVILADAGVRSHHCVLKRQADKFFLRTIEGALNVDGHEQDPGATIFVPLRVPVIIGSAAFEIVATNSPVDAPPEVQENEHSPTKAPPSRSLVSRLLRRRPLSVTAAVAAIIATVFAVRAISLGIGAQSAQGATGEAIAAAAVTSRSGASIAHDVAEVLRLSGITCEAQYNGDGAVTVSGHLGDPQALEAIVKSRAIREIVGLKRVLAINIDHPGGSTRGTTVDGTRIVSVVASADPYVVTADGSRYYIGASLPQGGRLAGVKEGEVLVERDGHTEHWKLADPTHAAGEFRPTGNPERLVSGQRSRNEE